MHKLYELKEKLMRELEDYADNGKFSKEDVEAIKYTASAIDHICNIVEDMDGEYSEAGVNSYEPYDTSYGRMGNSYARRNRGSYRGRSRRSYEYRGYSRTEDLAEKLREIMNDAPDERVRMEIKKLADKVEQM